jgi:hypothetical protein
LILGCPKTKKSKKKKKKKKKKILGCARPKYFFFGLSNLLPQNIRLPLISFFFGISYIWGSYSWGSSTRNRQ